MTQTSLWLWSSQKHDLIEGLGGLQCQKPRWSPTEWQAILAIVCCADKVVVDWRNGCFCEVGWHVCRLIDRQQIVSVRMGSEYLGNNTLDEFRYVGQVGHGSVRAGVVRVQICFSWAMAEICQISGTGFIMWQMTSAMWPETLQQPSRGTGSNWHDFAGVVHQSDYLAERCRSERA